MNEEYYLFKRVDAPGAQVPKPPGRRYPPRVIFDVDPDIHARMRRAAKTKGLSLADYARQAALERLAKDPDVRKPVVLPARPPRRTLRSHTGRGSRRSSRAATPSTGTPSTWWCERVGGRARCSSGRWGWVTAAPPA